MPQTDRLPHVVIVGGGFGGLHAARRLKRAPVRVTLIDRRNFHLFQPLLYQVATGALSPANIAAPLRAILKRQKNTRVLLGEVTDIDLARRRVLLSDDVIDYDYLILAAGARDNYFGHDDWEIYAPGLKTVEDATDIRRRILLAFEAAERETDPETRQAWLTFVIVGGGATGVELAGAMGELAHHTLRGNFQSINPAEARILLLEGADRVLPPYVPKLSAKAAAALAKLGVTVRTGTFVTDIQQDEVTVRSGDKMERIATHTVLWAAGVRASSLSLVLSKAQGVDQDRSARVIVQPDLTIPGHAEVFVIGDMAQCKDEAGKPLPGVAPVAIQQGRYAADLIQKRLHGETLPPFKYKDRGSMATIGRNAAVVDLGWVRFSGFLAWLTWLFVHLMTLVLFSNRLLVFMQWAYNYITRNRSARLITGENVLPLKCPPASKADLQQGRPLEPHVGKV
jgi:NADH:ubiquinone reductase (H+-translocating)